VSVPDFTKTPWKHPLVWQSHLVHVTRDYVDGASFNVATCECGWVNRVELGAAGAGQVDADDAVNAHWLGVIAAAAN
jgi:hypothetical protein